MSEPKQAPSYFDRQIETESQITHLKWITAALLAGNILLAAGLYRAQKSPESVEPFVVSVDESGKWHVTDAGELRYRPDEQVMKYFLTTFVTAHFSRERATVKKDFERSVLFFDSTLAESVIDQERKEKTIEKFLADTLGEETLIRVSNIAIEDASGPVY